MLLREQVYERGLRAARALLANGWGRAQLERALAGRRAALPHLREWAQQQRGDAPLVLVHAPSVGEALMAQAIIAEVRRARADVRVAFTFFSPSAERVAARTGADVWSYLPWDTSREAHALLDTLRPAAIAFVRTEIWPVLGIHAQARAIPTLLLNAVLAEGSSRISPSARFLLGPAYRRLHAIGAVAADHAERFGRLGVPRERVHVTGDARFDQVAARVAALDESSPLLTRLQSQRLTLVAGSTWPEDEAALAAALATLPPAQQPRLILAPHQPTEDHLEGAECTFGAAGLALERLAKVEEQGAGEGHILVDRVGVLAELYALADVAYVGGGYGNAGLHSVVEPAALGVPVLYGPRHGNAIEGGELARAGGGIIAAPGELTAKLGELVSSEPARRETGDRAGAFVRSRMGGAAANAQLLLAAMQRAD